MFCSVMITLINENSSNMSDYKSISDNRPCKSSFKYRSMTMSSQECLKRLTGQICRRTLSKNTESSLQNNTER